jgi:hypothetical protein
MRLEDLVSLACSTSGKGAFVGDAEQLRYSKQCPPAPASNDHR